MRMLGRQVEADGGTKGHARDVGPLEETSRPLPSNVVRKERQRRHESWFRRVLRLLGIGDAPEGGPHGAGEPPPDIGVREPRRPKPFGSAGAAVLDPPRSELD